MSAVDGASGRVKTVVRTSWLVTQAVISGSTVAWSEQRGAGDEQFRKGFTSRIREVTLA